MPILPADDRSATARVVSLHPVGSPSPSRLPGHLADQVILITGAGRGIGRATAELFAREGARLVLCSRTRPELRATMTAIKAAGGTVVGAATDIGSLRQAKAIVRLAVERFGRLDILINNASVLGPRALIVKYPVGEWLRVLRCNLTGTFYVSREAARIMVKQRRGRIITLSSSVGRIGRAEWGAYAVSKFGVEGLTQVMANELSPFGISVMTFNPGATRTAMRAKAHPEEDPRRLPDPAAPAEALLRLAVSQDPSLSGKAFDLHNVPLPESIASR